MKGVFVMSDLMTFSDIYEKDVLKELNMDFDTLIEDSIERNKRKGKKLNKNFIMIGIVIIITALTALISVGVTKQQINTDIIVDPESLSLAINEMDEDAIFLDLREASDYHQKHIDVAINMPYNDSGELMLWYLSNKASKTSPIFLMCYSGNRASKAFELLESEGYQRLIYVSFGFDTYQAVMGDAGTFVSGKCPCEDEE